MIGIGPGLHRPRAGPSRFDAGPASDREVLDSPMVMINDRRAGNETAYLLNFR